LPLFLKGFYIALAISAQIYSFNIANRGVQKPLKKTGRY